MWLVLLQVPAQPVSDPDNRLLQAKKGMNNG